MASPKPELAARVRQTSAPKRLKRARKAYGFLATLVASCGIGVQGHALSHQTWVFGARAFVLSSVPALMKTSFGCAGSCV